MNFFIWLSLYSLVSAACDISHALWSPDYGDTVIEDLNQALPGVGIKQFKALNPGVNPNRIMSGETYTVPYGPKITIIPPATWSGNCPKTLLLHGDGKAQDTPTRSKPLMPLTTAESGFYTSQPTSGTTYDEIINRTPTSTGIGTSIITSTGSATTSADRKSTTTKSHRATFLTDSEPINQPSSETGKSVAPTTTSASVSQNTMNHTPTPDSNRKPHKAAVSIDSKPAGQTTGITSHNVNTVAKPTKGSKKAESLTASAEANSPTTRSHKTADTTDSKPASQVITDIPTGTSKPATTVSGETEVPTTGSCPCWTDCELQKRDSTYSKKTEVAVAKSFCNQFSEAPIAAKNPTKISEYSGFVVGAHISPGCTKSELDEAKCVEYLEEIENQCPRTGGFFERGCFYVWIVKRETT